MKTTQPVFLDLTKIRFPITAIVSILHRISGILIFLGLPFILWAFSLSLNSNESFQSITSLLSEPFYKMIFFLYLTAVLFHVIAGLRHLIMDFHMGDTLRSGRIGAVSVFVLFLISAVLLGLCLWS